ncbi:MAG: hypothetical protein KAW01_06305, partial [Deltaproteobacteria bacterium]|nr:hypothetical protein [Deltaproteobacteria bacterium]
MRCKFLTVFIICLIFLFSNLSSPFARTITLSWNPNTENDLAGYKVFVGLASAEYDTFYSVGKVDEYQLDLPSDEDDYYLALKAFDYSGNESAFSAEVVVEGSAGEPSNNPGSAAEYMSLYAAYGRAVSYCSQSPCDGAGNCEEDVLPCGGDYPYKYSDTRAGFKDIYNLNDPKILC